LGSFTGNPDNFLSLGSSLILCRLSYTTSIVTLIAAATELLELHVQPAEIGNSTYPTSGIVLNAVIMILVIFTILGLNIIGGVKVRPLCSITEATNNSSRCTGE